MAPHPDGGADEADGYGGGGGRRQQGAGAEGKEMLEGEEEEEEEVVEGDETEDQPLQDAGAAGEEEIPPFPVLSLAALAVAIFAHCYSLSSLFPYVGFAVMDTGVVKDRNEAGYAAGWVSASFMVGRILTSFFWGRYSDMNGRKPVVYIACVSIAVFSILFGLSTEFWQLLVTRFLLGFFNGMIGVSKTLISELCHKTQEAQGMGVITAMWSSGLILGPAAGGLLARPATRYGGSFDNYVFRTYPYLLPNMLGACLAVLALPMVWLFLPETHPAPWLPGETPTQRRLRIMCLGLPVGTWNWTGVTNGRGGGRGITTNNSGNSRSGNNNNSNNWSLLSTTRNSAYGGFLSRTRRSARRENEEEDDCCTGSTTTGDIEMQPLAFGPEKAADKLQFAADGGGDIRNVQEVAAPRPPPPPTMAFATPPTMLALPFAVRDVEECEGDDEHERENWQRYPEANGSRRRVVRRGWLPRTLRRPYSRVDEEELGNDAAGYDTGGGNAPSAGDGEDVTSIRALWQNKLAVHCLYLYWLFSLVVIAFDEAFPLLAIARLSSGGLGLNTAEIGHVLSGAGAVMILFQVFAYSRVVNWKGPVQAVRVSLMVAVPLYITMPFVHTYVMMHSHRNDDDNDDGDDTDDDNGGGDGDDDDSGGKIPDRLLPIVYVSLILMISTLKMCTNVSFATVSILINNSVTDDCRGALNGLSMTGGSLAKGAGPVFAAVMLAWSISRGLNFLTFSVLALGSACCSLLAYLWLPLKFPHNGVPVVEDSDEGPLPPARSDHVEDSPPEHDIDERPAHVAR